MSAEALILPAGPVPTAPGADYIGIHKARSIRTVARRKGEWLENVKANAGIIKNDLSLLWLDKNYPEMISVAAGPSLGADLEDLKRLRPGKELVVVDAALKFVLEAGLVPDFVISTDASEKILQMVDGLSHLEKVPPLILNVIANPAVARAWKGEVYWFVMANQFYDLDNQEMIQNLHSLTARVGTKLVPGGNVSSIALAFALSVRNAGKLYLFGHDFCWKDEMYCGGHLPHLAQERVDEENRAGTVFESVNTRGEKVVTSLSLQQFAAWHDDVVACLPNRVINRTSSTILKIPTT